jgi:hypothetical protein
VNGTEVKMVRSMCSISLFERMRNLQLVSRLGLEIVLKVVRSEIMVFGGGYVGEKISRRLL